MRFCGGELLGHVISQEGIVIDPNRVAIIMQAPTLASPKAHIYFLDQIRWHGHHHLQFLTHMAIPINGVAHVDTKAFV